MKKSNALMLSYMIFLIIALFANVIWKWNGLDKIAIAATIAGYFFALADLFDWKSTFNSYYCDKSKDLQNSIIDIDTAEIEFIEERKKELEYILEKATPYKGRDSDFDKLIDFSTETLESDKKTKENCEQSIAIFTKLHKNVENRSKKRYDVASLVLMVLGFVSFFSVIVFGFFANFLSNCQSFLTVIAFVVIMFNYYSKDVIENNMKAELSELTEKSKQGKKRQDELNLEYTKLKLSNQVDAFIERFKETENNSNVLEENKANG